ncbi:pyridoxal phosphate-dependent aminotransferase [Rubricoccus marinus]|uniref:Aminotransferase n=1 Tax=Rubricoccus marinus TaxID=716817 RepID=A0A259TYU9_9BACT|nr:pyridoxal phosphate-dependent aminotransferase [Rubricoccus marinus]OZC02870.1 aspartate aminotransferase [Rubricoccus marinus]
MTEIATSHVTETLNRHVETVQPSATLAVSARAKSLSSQGHDIVSLSAGEPDFGTPQPIVDAAHQALRDGFTHYTPNAGIPALREAVAAKLQRDGIDVQAQNVLCSNGAKQSVAQAVLAVCGPGDEVLIPAPYWVSYPEMARLAGATPVPVATRVADGYTMTPEALRAAITDQSRVLLFNSPSNPTGAVYSPELVRELADVIREHPNLLVVSDEIYAQVVFDAQHLSMASLPGMLERTMTINGFSKAYAMTGWRLGYAAGPLWWADAMATIQSQITSGPSSISQKAGVAALEMDSAPLDKMVGAFRQRRDAFLARLDAIDGVQCPKPEGAFYLFPDVSAYYGTTTASGATISGSADLCLYLLEEHGVALVPGVAFGDDNGVRISYAAGMDDLMKAADRIEGGLGALR